MAEPGWVEVYSAESFRAAREAALVLTAVGIDNEVHRSASGWILIVAGVHQDQAIDHLKRYWAENVPSAIQPVEATLIDSGWPGVLGYLIVIWSIPALQSFSEANFLSLGRLSAGAVMEGELYRSITALTLHADIGHIASNTLFGTLFGLFVGRYLGSGLGWLLVLLCGCAANLLNALVQPAQFNAIGASTATFAALGLVPAFGWRRGFFRGRGFKRGFAPIFAAICLLTYTGFGSERVDVLGHVFGFAAGVGMGLAVAHIDLARISASDQQRAGVFAIILVATAWLFASLP